MTLTRITAVTGLLTLVLQAVVLLGWWDLTTDELAWFTGALVTAGGLVHSFFNPNIPIGKTD
jgi:hypothetical protein